jgi:outer membrane receptor for ferrienterochelin and colicins
LTRLRFALPLLLVLVSAPEPSVAVPSVETRFFDDLARQAYARGDYRAALQAFLQADAVTPSPRSSYNIGLCAHLAAEPGLAYAYFERYLAGPDHDAGRRADAARRMQALQSSLALVRVESDPPGATIVVDRAELGDYGTTPRTVPLAPGEHRVELSLEGHHPASTSVAAVRGELGEATLRLEPRTGSLETRVQPASAELELSRDGKPLSLRRSGAVKLAVGRYLLRAKAPGHLPAETDVTIREAETSAVELALLPVPAPAGRLVIETPGVAAEVLLNGKAMTMTPARLDGVVAGSHRVELRARGYRVWKGRVKVDANKAAFVSVTLQRQR